MANKEGCFRQPHGASIFWRDCPRLLTDSERVTNLITFSDEPVSQNLWGYYSSYNILPHSILDSSMMSLRKSPNLIERDGSIQTSSLFSSHIKPCRTTVKWSVLPWGSKQHNKLEVPLQQPVGFCRSGHSQNNTALKFCYDIDHLMIFLFIFWTILALYNKKQSLIVSWHYRSKLGIWNHSRNICHAHYQWSIFTQVWLLLVIPFWG